MRVRKSSTGEHSGGMLRFGSLVNGAKHALKTGAALLASMAMLTAGTAFADYEDAPKTTTTAVDENTSRLYAESLGGTNSTRYAGRVWNDKTVSDEDMTFDGLTNGNVSKGDSDFLVTYSLLATSQQITQLPKVPVDVVFVLDFSASMTWGVDKKTVSKSDGSDSRIKYMVDALNNTIDALAKDSDPDHPNRIGIAYFNQVGFTLLPLTELSAENTANVRDQNRDDKLDYVYLSYFSGTSGQDNGKATVTCDIGERSSASTDSKTNIQYGLHTGMSMLADAETTTFEYGEGTYTRIPNVVLMSDGAPTTISLPEDADRSSTGMYTGSWWSGLNYNNGKSVGWGDNDRAWSANGMMPMLTAQYFKNKIDAHYAQKLNLKNADQASSTMYTIGFGINRQTDSMVELANMVLNPAKNWGSHTDPACQDIVGAWDKYWSNDSPILQYPINKSRDAGEFKAEHPDDYDPKTKVPDYVDAYYPADNADALEDAFREITNAITETAKAPTKTTNSDPVNSGYVTYTDPIGEYMHVDSVKTLIYADQRFDLDAVNGVVSSGNTKTYKFNGSVGSPVYGNHNVSEIRIVVTNNDGKETLTVQVPASVIPIRVNEVDVLADGTVKRNVSNGAMPLRLVYGVKLNDDVMQNGVLNTLKVDDAYIQNHSDGNGNVLFYTNLYSGKQFSGNAQVENGGTTVGDANVTFQPADDNPFYFVQDNIPLSVGNYDSKDQILKDAVPAKGPVDPDAKYYFPITFYEDKTKVTKWVERSGSQLEGYVQATGEGNQLEIQKGSPRLGNLTDLSRSKADGNATDTAVQRLYPTFEAKDTDTIDPHNGQFRVYLGNNGRLQVPTVQPTTLTAEQALAVTKNLQGKDLSANTSDNNNFEFAITPQSTTDSSGQTVTTAEDAGAKLRLPDQADDNIDGTLHFYNNAASMVNGTSTDTMHPITAGLTFTADDIDKAYTYQVSEVVPEDRPIGYDYDENTHTVVYGVSQSQENGQLVITVTVDGTQVDLHSSAIPTVVFNNTYIEPVSVLPLTGGDATARNVLLAGGGVLLLAGGAWLLARRRRV